MKSDREPRTDRLIIAPGRAPRQGWNEAFSAAGSADQDELLLDDLLPNQFDREDWLW